MSPYSTAQLRSSGSGFIKYRMWFVLVFLPFWVACGMTESQIKKKNESTAHYKFGIAYSRDNPPNLQKAYLEFQKAVKLDPRNRDAYYALGDVHFKREDYDKAIGSFEKTLSIDPGFSEAHNYMGTAYEIQGRLEKAIGEYHKALENTEYATPQFPHWNLGSLYLKQERYDDALREFKDVLRFDPESVIAHNGLGKVHHQEGRFKEAIVSYQHALKRAPEYLDAHYNLAFSYMKKGSKDLAAKSFEKVIELSPQSDSAKEAEKFLDALQ